MNREADEGWDVAAHPQTDPRPLGAPAYLGKHLIRDEDSRYPPHEVYLLRLLLRHGPRERPEGRRPVDIVLPPREHLLREPPAAALYRQVLQIEGRVERVAVVPADHLVAAEDYLNIEYSARTGRNTAILKDAASDISGIAEMRLISLAHAFVFEYFEDASSDRFMQGCLQSFLALTMETLEGLFGYDEWNGAVDSYLQTCEDVFDGYSEDKNLDSRILALSTDADLYSTKAWPGKTLRDASKATYAASRLRAPAHLRHRAFLHRDVRQGR